MSDVVEGRFSRRRLLGAAGIVTAGTVAPAIFGTAEAEAKYPHAVGTFYLGANLSGLEDGSTVPGTPNTDYAVPTHAELDFLHSRGLNTVRLPFKWERTQPTLSGALDSAYLGLVTGLIDYAASIGMLVIPDVHNFGAYGSHKIGDGTVTSAHFADLWSRLATEFVGRAGIAGYDIMNEPSNMPSTTAWPDAAQAAINAIRAVDTTTTIIAEGDNWASAASWVSVNGNLNLSDPANNLVYSAHTYFDRDSSGTHFDWATEVAAGDQLQSPPGPLTTQIGVQRLTGYVNWLAEHGYRGLVGEVGTGSDDPHWLETLDNTLAYCQANKVAVTYWAAGPWFQAYAMGIEPQPDGRDTVQVAVLEKYTGAPSPKPYYLSGPQGGDGGVESQPFVVDYRGYVTKKIVITPNDGGGGGSFAPASVALDTGFNGLGSFTYTPAAGIADYSIGCTNNGGLTNPAPLQYSTSPDIDWDTTATNVVALGRLLPGFTGSAVTLQRSSDSAQASFAFRSDGTLDQAAITSWAGGAEVLVVTVADQGAGKRDAGIVVTQNHDSPDQTQLNSSPADYPTLVTNGLGGMPVLRFNQSRMDAASPIDGLHGFTCFVVCKPTTVASMQRLLSWHFTQYLLLSGDSSGSWQQSGEPDLSLGVDPSAWHIYAVRYQAGYQRTTWVDGQQVATTGTATSAIRFQFDSHVNIGYFRWYPGVFFQGDVWGFLPFSVALTDAQMGTVWSLLSNATGIAV